MLATSLALAGHPREAKALLASEVTAFYHSEEAAREAAREAGDGGSEVGHRIHQGAIQVEHHQARQAPVEQPLQGAHQAWASSARRACAASLAASAFPAAGLCFWQWSLVVMGCAAPALQYRSFHGLSLLSLLLVQASTH